jgi:MoxR-like ATPase
MKKDAPVVKMLPVDSDNFVLKNRIRYVEVDDEFKLIKAHLENGAPLIFEGPKGLGKTLAFAAFAQKHKIPIIQFDCSEGTRYSHLYGSFVLLGEEAWFKPGVFPMAFEIANEKTFCILVLEEINSLSPQVQKMICPATDYRSSVFVQELGQTFRCSENSRVLIAGTMNPSYYGGVSELNEDLKSRFSIHKFTFPKPSQEADIISCDDKELTSKLLQLAVETRKSHEEQSLSYALSPRDLHTAAKMHTIYKEQWPEKQALVFMLKTCIVGKFSPEESETIRARIDSIFGITLS